MLGHGTGEVELWAGDDAVWNPQKREQRYRKYGEEKDYIWIFIFCYRYSPHLFGEIYSSQND
jgi:hypothetical protein